MAKQTKENSFETASSQVPKKYMDHFSFFIFLIILGIKNEKMNRATEKKTFSETSCPQSPLDQTSFSVPIKNVKTKVPTMIPKPVPKK